MAGTPILQLEAIRKMYEKHLAVNDVSFTMPQGSIFGLLGPNGAGKTSLIRIITTITRADAGQVWIRGEALRTDHQDIIGYMPEERGMYKKMKLGEHLLYLGQLKGMSLPDAKKAIDHYVQKFDIGTWLNKKIEELSKGMQQKAQFIATVLHAPALIILDEPFSGLDPINSKVIEEEIRNLNRNGTSIIFSTHRMEQVEHICNDILLINRGRKVLDGNVEEIKNAYKENLFRIKYQGGELPFQQLPALTRNHSYDPVTRGGKIDFQLQNQTSNALIQWCIEQQVQITGFKEILPSINDIFIRRVQETETVAA